MTDSEKIFRKLKSSRKLPSLPQVLLKLIHVCNDEESSIEQVAGIISKDPSLSAKLLQLANSSYMGLSTKADSIENAAVYLGLDNIITFAMSASVLHAFGSLSKKSSFDLNRFWWHSILCALLARRIAAEISHTSPDEAFLAGFLHDIGRLILGANFEKEFQEIEKRARGHQDLLLLEKAAFGVTHADVGAWLVRQWKIKTFLADAIGFHHERVEEVADAFPLVKIVFVANSLCRQDLDGGGEGLKEADAIFGFNPAQVEGLVHQAREEAVAVARSFGIEVEAFLDSESPENDNASGGHEAALLNDVKSYSLLYGTLQNLLKADSRDAIIKIIEGSLKVLFNTGDVFFFFYESENDLLIGYSPPGSPYEQIINGLVIPLSNRKSLIVKSLTSRSVMDSFGQLTAGGRSIVDDQMKGLLSAEGMICLPMHAFQSPIGIMVAAMDRAAERQLPDQLKLMRLFANHSAICFHIDSVKESKAVWLQSERVAAASLIARKVVHEVNNPLGIIKNYLKILGTKLPASHPSTGDHPYADDLAIINEEIERVTRIVHQLSDFSELQAGEKESFDINAFISDLVNIIRASILSSFQIRIHLDLDRTLPHIVTERDSLKQVFINLIKNATEAMRKGGHIHVVTKSVHASEKIMGDKEDVPQDIEILFRDDGPGIRDDIRAHLFEPYNTSKGKGHSGLGLSIAHGIITRLKGTITCLDNAETGTVFRITLPAAIL